jgi:hypothetical protein
MPLPLKVIGVFSKNDLKPSNSTLRSFNTHPSQVIASSARRQKKSKRSLCLIARSAQTASLAPHRQKKLLFSFV